jgi:pyridoxine/pyridoxamine 5'-phosphate oxidase
MRFDGELPLQLRGGPEYNTWTDYRVPPELIGQSSQEGITLRWMDRPRRLHDRVVFGI